MSDPLPLPSLMKRVQTGFVGVKLCPWHQDGLNTTPLSVRTVSKHLQHCFGCDSSLIWMIKPNHLEDLLVIIVVRATNISSHPTTTPAEQRQTFFFVNRLSSLDLEEVALPHRFSWNIFENVGNCRCRCNKTCFKDFMSGILTCHVAFLLEGNCESIKQHLALIQVVKEKRPLTASKEDTHRDARHSWLCPPPLTVMKSAENCTPELLVEPRTVCTRTKS